MVCTSQTRVSTAEELQDIISPSSLPTFLGGEVPYDNDTWVKFRCVSFFISPLLLELYFSKTLVSGGLNFPYSVYLMIHSRS